MQFVKTLFENNTTLAKIGYLTNERMKLDLLNTLGGIWSEIKVSVLSVSTKRIWAQRQPTTSSYSELKTFGFQDSFPNCVGAY